MQMLDILFGINKVKKYIENLRKEHWEGMKWIFQYLKDIKNASITFVLHLYDI